MLPRIGPQRSVVPTNTAPTAPGGTLRLRLRCLLNLGTWLLLTGLLFGQIFGIVLTTVTTSGRTFYGQPLEKGLYDIPGSNDEPYTDRAVACVQSGRVYQAVQLSQLLRQHEQQLTTPASTRPTPYPTNGQDAYRVVSRDSFTMDASQYYATHCNALSTTIQEVFKACEQLGYNVTRDVLRVVDGVDSEDVVAIPRTLPVLILPYWDATPYARYVVPSYDGSACMFRTSGMFEDASDPTAVLWGVSRAIRENKTAMWLGYPGGEWRHGWYEDPVVKMRWYTDVISSQVDGPHGVYARRFDIMKGADELDCSEINPSNCGGTVWRFNWNDELSAVYDTPWFHSVTISNGARFGLFLYEDVVFLTTTGRYTLGGFISNISFAVLLARWMIAMVALYPADTIGLAAISNSFSFKILPFLLLPRMRSSLEAFWTVGCAFDGDQSAVENAWFTIYPAIGEIVLLVFSVLNVIAKLGRRRMSDVLFGPTLLVFVLLHALRFHWASLSLFDGDKRVTGVITAEQVDAARVIDYFTTDLAFRTNGRVKTIFIAKMVVLVINVVPIVLTSRRVPDTVGEDDGSNHLNIEKALAIHFASSGGLGSTAVSVESVAHGDYGFVTVLRPYELARAGYIVVGYHAATTKLVTIDHWCLLLVATRLRSTDLVSVWLVVYDMSVRAKATLFDGKYGVADVRLHPRTLTGNDRSLVKVEETRISVCAFC